jgi:hypothetical protein
VIADRVLKELDESKEHVQPQWVIDSLNAGRAKPCAPYKPGENAPPHLSPFVEPDEEEDASDSDDEAAAAPPPPPEKEAKDMAKMLMSKKAKRLYGRMQHGRERKQAAVARLRKRRELLAARSRQ